MGLMGLIFNTMFGSSGNVVSETAEVFRENAEAASAREAGLQKAAIEAFAAEFSHARKGRFDRFMDGLNRVPRPALALSTLGLFLAAMLNPVWFADRMEGVALVPEPLWWLMGAIVSFYFGARHQVKGQEFQRAIAGSLARIENKRRAREAAPAEPALLQADESTDPRPRPTPVKEAEGPKRPVDVSGNAALRDWRESRRGR